MEWPKALARNGSMEEERMARESPEQDRTRVQEAKGSKRRKSCDGEDTKKRQAEE
jgi:hypothetical protein